MGSTSGRGIRALLSLMRGGSTGRMSVGDDAHLFNRVGRGSTCGEEQQSFVESVETVSLNASDSLFHTSNQLHTRREPTSREGDLLLIVEAALQTPAPADAVSSCLVVQVPAENHSLGQVLTTQHAPKTVSHRWPRVRSSEQLLRAAGCDEFPPPAGLTSLYVSIPSPSLSALCMMSYAAQSMMACAVTKSVWWACRTVRESARRSAGCRGRFEDAAV